jgi:hypothetical protein
MISFTQNSVTVEIRLEGDEQRGLVLAASFTPLEPGYHLYSKDLSRTGINGAGRPTLLEIVTAGSGGLQAAGELAESVAAIPEVTEGFDEPFWVYPAGPVTLRLPVSRAPGMAPGAATELAFTYMTCSGANCLAPVISKIISVNL